MTSASDRPGSRPHDGLTAEGSALYLDHNATTPVDPQVLEAMLPYLREEFGNPSSTHAAGRRARAAVERARGRVAALIGADADEILFTSGGTESINLAIRGAAVARRDRRHIVSTRFEHPATDQSLRRLEGRGWWVHRVAPEADGRVSARTMAAALSAETVLVTLLHAQNEIGTLQPIAAIAADARRVGALVHVNAAQSPGKVPVDVEALGVDLLSLSGHKLCAPKGVGALYVRRGTALGPVLEGGRQEGGMRPGTENVPGIVGMGEACRLAAERLADDMARMQVLQDRLWERLAAAVPGAVRVGHPQERLPNTLVVLFPGVSGGRVLAEAPQVMASTGATWEGGKERPSQALLATGLPPATALGAVRLSVGRTTTADEADAAAEALAAGWRRLTGA